MGGKLLDCHATSKDFERKLGRRFSVDEAILENLTPTTSNSSFSSEDSETTTTSLLSLPYELLTLIFQSLPHAPSQIALALTCKQLACVSQSIELARCYTSPKYAGALPKEVFDIPCLMKQLSTWVPEHLQLCDHCLTSRPLDPSYWADVAGIAGGKADAVLWITKNGWSFSNASWHKQTHNICPGCRATCSISDFGDCDGCRVLGRLGDVDWSRVGDGGFRRREIEREIRAVVDFLEHLGAQIVESMEVDYFVEYL